MQDVILYNAAGQFVVSGKVPPFLDGHEAEVLLWGDRVFTLNKTSAAGLPLRDPTGALRYTEAFAVALASVD
jgi:hypothetical protein